MDCKNHTEAATVRIYKDINAKTKVNLHVLYSCVKIHSFIDSTDRVYCYQFLICLVLFVFVSIFLHRKLKTNKSSITLVIMITI